MTAFTKKNYRNKITSAILSSCLVLSLAPLTSSAQSEDLFAPVSNQEDQGQLNLVNPNDLGKLPGYVGSDAARQESNNKEDVLPNGNSSDRAETNVQAQPKSAPRGLPIVPNSVRDNALSKNEIIKNSFNEALIESQGLTPDMIREAKRISNEKQKAYDYNANEEFNVSSRTLKVSLGISKQKEIIKLAEGYSTSISVVDSSGRPWDVENVEVGNKNKFKIERLDGPNGYLFSLTALGNVGRSNVIFVLKEGLSNKSVKVPIVFDVVTGQRTVDDNLVVRVQAVGPNGSIETAKLAEGADSKYIAWLDGVLPSGVKKLKSDDANLKAWVDDDGSIVVITRYEVYSPTSSVMLGSSDGQAFLYKLTSKASIIRVKDRVNQEVGKVRISGF